jgi:hypothetical protein
MDVGNLKQPFGKSSKDHPLGSGMFKVGDYDDEEPAAPKSQGSFTESIKSGFDKVHDKIHPHHDTGAETAKPATTTTSAPAPAPTPENK